VGRTKKWKGGGRGKEIDKKRREKKGSCSISVSSTIDLCCVLRVSPSGRNREKGEKEKTKRREREEGKKEELPCQAIFVIMHTPNLLGLNNGGKKETPKRRRPDALRQEQVNPLYLPPPGQNELGGEGGGGGNITRGKKGRKKGGVWVFNKLTHSTYLALDTHQMRSGTEEKKKSSF